MAARCQLCDGRIVNGKCVDCGMDYSRMKSRYHLNENCDDYDLNARQINDDYEKTLLESDELHRGRKKEREKARLNAKASVKPNQRRKPSREEMGARKEKSGSQSSSYSYSSGPAEKKPKKKSGGLLGWIVIICMFLPFVSLFLNDDDDVVFDDSDDSSYTEYSYVSESYSEAAEDDELHIYRITHGCYRIGEDLPSGDYEISNMDSENSVRIYIDQDDQEYDNFAVEAGSVYEEQLELYDGQTLRLPDLADVKLVCRNAQMDDIQDFVNYDEQGTVMAYSLDGNGVVTAEVSAGGELEPGRYNVRFQGEGVSVAGISVDDFINSYFMLSAAENQPGADLYYGLELSEGDTIQMTRYGDDTDVEISFIPIDYYNYAEERFDPEGDVEKEDWESSGESSGEASSDDDSVVETDSSL